MNKNKIKLLLLFTLIITVCLSACGSKNEAPKRKPSLIPTNQSISADAQNTKISVQDDSNGITQEEPRDLLINEEPSDDKQMFSTGHKYGIDPQTLKSGGRMCFADGELFYTVEADWYTSNLYEINLDGSNDRMVAMNVGDCPNYDFRGGIWTITAGSQVKTELHCYDIATGVDEAKIFLDDKYDGIGSMLIIDNNLYATVYTASSFLHYDYIIIRYDLETNTLYKIIEAEETEFYPQQIYGTDGKYIYYEMYEHMNNMTTSVWRINAYATSPDDAQNQKVLKAYHPNIGEESRRSNNYTHLAENGFYTLSNAHEAYVFYDYSDIDFEGDTVEWEPHIISPYRTFWSIDNIHQSPYIWRINGKLVSIYYGTMWVSKGDDFASAQEKYKFGYDIEREKDITGGNYHDVFCMNTGTFYLLSYEYDYYSEQRTNQKFTALPIE